MKVIALIPARYAASRFPAKLMSDLCGKPVIVRTYLSTLATGVFDKVMVVTDHRDIADQITAIGGDVYFSHFPHESGSDRIAEAARNMEGDIFVNVQGDEPFQDTRSLADLVAAFKSPEVKVASLMSCFTPVDGSVNSNIVKVVVDKNDYALYFSRSEIPFFRNTAVTRKAYRHIGVYAYRKETLLTFTQMDKTYLEEAEMLEQLRLLENGIRIKMVETQHEAIAIDTPEDLQKAIHYFQKLNE
ncbi:3-deoxy-manno-octulosonate cytidylyltransferase [Anditalea andensis]|uniref:3-deoxy-manno-octulosonate cytidylyltransferase n=1 Tax=Anditalea andensis TaxID=1048983 RepID=A0A074L137_9BACT|nr:3-deoxy-manno-octulosonate cytidylyltransferase [Anditalea andensis]KEO74175.1 3-deoxy-manno-octulosonate cytidylyltransferase [Anditalea andensis]